MNYKRERLERVKEIKARKLAERMKRKVPMHIITCENCGEEMRFTAEIAKCPNCGWVPVNVHVRRA